MSRGKRKTLEEMPRDELIAQKANYDQVSLKIARRNEKGQIQAVYGNVLMTIDEIFDIDEWLKTNSGGGRYRIEVRDPNDKTRYVVEPFIVGVEGPPRAPRFLGSPGAVTADGGPPPPMAPYTMTPTTGQQQMYDPSNPYGRGGYGQIHNTPILGHQQPQPPPSAWLNGVHPSLRAGYLGSSYRAPGGISQADQVALRQLEEQKAEHRAQIAKLEEQNKALLNRLERMAEEQKEERERAREERFKVQYDALKQQLEHRSSKEEKGMAEQLAAFAPFVPVLVAMVNKNSESGAKALEVQQAGIQSLMTATLGQANKPDSTMEMLKTFGPLLLPLVKDMMDARSPKAQAELFNSMVENNLNSTAMMAQLIEAFANAGGDEPWYLPMVREAMSGVVGMTEAYMRSAGGLPGQSPALPGVQAAPAMPKGAPAKPGTTYTTLEDAEVMDIDGTPVAVAPTDGAGQPPEHAAVAGVPSTEDVEEAATTPVEEQLLENATPVQRIMLARLPQEFQTREWRTITLALHQTEDVEELSELIASHLQHSINFGMLPKALHDLEHDPASALSRVLSPLPIATSNPELARAVMERVIWILGENGFLAVPEPMAEQVAAAEVAGATEAAQDAAPTAATA